MDRVHDIISGAQDALTVKRVFGEPYERNGVTIIPAATVFGGGGGGGGEGGGDPNADPDAEPASKGDWGRGFGTGFGLTARPAGAFVIRGDEVTWEPAIDITRVVAGAQVLGVAFLLTVRTYIKRRRRVRHR